MRIAALTALLATLGWFALTAFAQEETDEPGLNDEAKYERWKLTFEEGKPDYIALTDPSGSTRLYWYVTYRVTNSNASDVPLRLRITAETDTGKTYRDTLFPRAERALEKKTGKQYRNAVEMFRDTLPSGESVDAVAFFGEVDPNWDDLTVRVTGLVDPVDKRDGKLYFEQQRLVLHWNRPGDEYDSADDVITFKGRRWEIEGKVEEIPQEPVR